MRITDENKKYILNEFLKNISHISDKEYQERVWIKGDGPECDDFTETVCHFFDDGDPILESYKNYGITDEQYAVLLELRSEFESFSEDNHFPELFIGTPEWTMITNLAKEVLVAFNYTETRN